MNNDNEKDLYETNPEKVTEEIAEDNAQESIASETPCHCCDCCGCSEHNCNDAEDTDSECDANLNNSAEAKKSKCPVVTPVIIAAVAFVLVAAVVLGGLFIYKTFFMGGPKGVWMLEGTEDSGVYFELDAPDKEGKGDIYLRGGGISYFGTYELVTCNVDEDEVSEFVTNFSAVEPLSGEVTVLKSDFYMFGMNGGEFIFSTGASDGKDTMTLKTLDSYGSVAEMKFVESELPDIKIDPTKITNASADEAGVTTLNIDKNILGTWSDATYGTYTFYEGGTANYKTEYQVDPTYMLYGITMGYGVDLDFKYTVDNGNIYMTADYYTGESKDDVLAYTLSKDTLFINGVDYAKVQ